jgi:hypothetical protein
MTIEAAAGLDRDALDLGLSQIGVAAAEAVVEVDGQRYRHTA